tara:strand:+ start:165 stop:707 length:543 start_codon:yes stop_codon:yes gene_type:complete
VAATIHATLKGESSNSYVTLAEANSYFETSPDDSTWTNKTDDQKNRALISACRWIDDLIFFGDRCDESQALKWPRNNFQVDDVELACTLIPAKIKHAQFELARALANDPDAMTGNKGTEGVVKEIEVEIGDLKEKKKYNEPSLATGKVNNVFDVYPWLQSYLGSYCLGGAGGYQVRVVRG